MSELRDLLLIAGCIALAFFAGYCDPDGRKPRRPRSDRHSLDAD